eukprot:Transcript_11426.p1 GENE.Transcript_11426~~Transcript_11426.p1  ORF type:complete len:461 (-),score=130.81 Transcript_11426:113-1495(-)
MAKQRSRASPLRALGIDPDLTKTIGGTKLTLQPIKPLGIKITTFDRWEKEQQHSPEDPPVQAPAKRHASPASSSASLKANTPRALRSVTPAQQLVRPGTALPRAKSVPSTKTGAAAATARAPRASKIPTNQRTQPSTRVRKLTSERPRLDTPPRPTRQRTGDCTPPPELGRSGSVSTDLGALSLARATPTPEPEPTAAAAPRASAPQPSPRTLSQLPDASIYKVRQIPRGQHLSRLQQAWTRLQEPSSEARAEPKAGARGAAAHGDWCDAEAAADGGDGGGGGGGDGDGVGGERENQEARSKFIQERIAACDRPSPPSPPFSRRRAAASATSPTPSAAERLVAGSPDRDEEVQLLLRPQRGLDDVRAALRLDDALDAAAAARKVNRGTLLKRLLEEGGGEAARGGIGLAEWRALQAQARAMVEPATYAHRVLRYKYQDATDQRMAREMLLRCEAFLARHA